MVAKVPIRQPEHQPVAEGIELLRRSRLRNACAAATGFPEGRHRDRGGTCEGGVRRRREIHVKLKEGSLAQFVGKRAVEKDAPRKSPKAGLSHSAWKSRKSRAISTFPTAPATTNQFPFSP